MKLLFSVVLFFIFYIIGSPTTAAQVNPKQDNDNLCDWITITKNNDQLQNDNQTKLSCHLLSEPYAVSSTGIHTKNGGDLFVRITPLDFQNVAPMPGSFDVHAEKSRSQNCFDNVE